MVASTYDWPRIFKACAPRANPEFVKAFAANADAIERELDDDVETMAGQLGQLSHETNGFREFSENLNYTAKRITEVWPSRFPTQASARPFAGNPQALANKVYNGRMGNVMGSDDGWRFRGCGAIHHTGRQEHETRAKTLGMTPEAFADAMRVPANALLIMRAAISYCRGRGVLTMMARGDHTSAGRAINGGRTGEAERLANVTKFRAAIRGNRLIASVSPPAPAPSPVTPTKPAAAVVNPPMPSVPVSAPPKRGFGAWLAAIFTKRIGV